MKTPLVLISGLLSDKNLWKHQVEHLSDIASIQVFSPSENSPEAMIKHILDESPPTFALAGHSMGGWLSLEMMRVAPSRVTKLCLLNTTSRRDSDKKRIQREKMIQMAEQGQFDKVIKKLLDHFVFQSSAKEQVEKMFLAVGKEAFIRQEQSMMKRRELTSLLPTIACKTLVIHAAEDKNFSLKEHQELAKQIPKAYLAIIEDSGHMSPMEMPEAVTDLLRLWLK